MSNRNHCPVLGSRLAAVLARRGIKRNELAQMCGVSQTAVTKWLQGQRPRPSIMLLLSHQWGDETTRYILGDLDVMPEPPKA